MIKKMFVFVVLLSFLFCGNVYAASSDEITGSDEITDSGELSASKDDVGRFITGYGSLKLNYDDGYSLTTYNFSVDDGLGYIYVVERINGNQYVYYLNGSGSCTYDIELFRHFSENDRDSFNTSTYTNTLKDFNGSNYGIYLFQYGFDDDYVLNFNIPVFSSEDIEGINKYINDGDYSSANNADDVGGNSEDDAEYSDEIELPHNLTMIGRFRPEITKNNGLKWLSEPLIRWDYPKDWQNYNYDIQFAVNYIDIKFQTHNGNWTSLKNYIGTYGEQYSLDGSPVDYSDAKESLIITKEMQENLLPHDVVADYFNLRSITQIKFRVRNRKDGKCSNWVVLNSEVVGGNSSVHEENPDDETVPSDEYNFQDVTENNSDVSTDVNIKGLISYIKGGFGLLGNNGIITLMSSCFVYLPASIWTMLKFLVAMMIAISIIGLVKDVVT